jgi:hypothetical protein
VKDKNSEFREDRISVQKGCYKFSTLGGMRNCLMTRTFISMDTHWYWSAWACGYAQSPFSTSMLSLEHFGKAVEVTLVQSKSCFLSLFWIAFLLRLLLFSCINYLGVLNIKVAWQLLSCDVYCLLHFLQFIWNSALPFICHCGLLFVKVCEAYTNI